MLLYVIICYYLVWNLLTVRSSFCVIYFMPEVDRAAEVGACDRAAGGWDGPHHGEEWFCVIHFMSGDRAAEVWARDQAAGG